MRSGPCDAPLLPLLLLQVARRGIDLAAADALVFDMPADGLPGQSCALDEINLLVRLAGRVKSCGQAGGALLLAPHVGKGFVEFSHLRLRIHAVMLPHRYGQHHSTIPANRCGPFAKATLMWHHRERASDTPRRRRTTV